MENRSLVAKGWGGGRFRPQRAGVQNYPISFPSCDGEYVGLYRNVFKFIK